MTVLPAHIKQNGYIAKRNDERYIVEYMSGGHIPLEESVELTIKEMETIYIDYSKWDEVIVQAKIAQQSN